MYSPPPIVVAGLDGAKCLPLARRRLTIMFLLPVAAIWALLLLGNSIEKRFSYASPGFRFSFPMSPFRFSLVAWDFLDRVPSKISYALVVPELNVPLLLFATAFVFAPVCTYLPALGAVFGLALWRRARRRDPKFQVARAFVLTTLFLPGTMVGLLGTLAVMFLYLLEYFFRPVPVPLFDDRHMTAWVCVVIVSASVSSLWGCLLLIRLYGIGIAANPLARRISQTLVCVCWCIVNVAAWAVPSSLILGGWI